jgi:hypothetical protein
VIIMTRQPTIPLTAKRTDTFSLPSLEGTPKAFTVQIRIPTPSERDTIGGRLFELGLAPVSDETIRAHMVDELYKIDWAADAGEQLLATLSTPEERAAYNERIAEEKAEFLDSYWSRQALDNEIQAAWMEKETQRLLDEEAGAPPREPTPLPKKLIKLRDHSRGQITVNDIVARSERVRHLSAQRGDYARRQAELMVRLQLLRISPEDPAAFLKAEKEAGVQVTLDRGDDGLVTVDAIDRLREFIGDTAWRELVERVDAHYSLSETERKNSDSPLGKQSDQTGSPAPSGDSGNSDGESTRSPTGPAPTAE